MTWQCVNQLGNAAEFVELREATLTFQKHLRKRMTYKHAQKSVLLISFHFPPVAESSGLQRTLGYTRYLPDHDWQPLILTATPSAYTRTHDAQFDLIPVGTVVRRALCFDAQRHLSIRGRYPDSFGIPDRWKTWLPAAYLTGLSMIRKYRPATLWSTYPIATSHRIGAALAKRSGLPWIADFRDPMVEYVSRTDSYKPLDPRMRKARLSIEADCVKHASGLVFCTNRSRDICLERHEMLEQDRCHVVPNGYEESIFLNAEAKRDTTQVQKDNRITILHSGTIYRSPDRNPGIFLDAVANLAEKGAFRDKPLRIILRATGNNDYFAKMIAERQLVDTVELAPP